MRKTSMPPGVTDPRSREPQVKVRLQADPDNPRITVLAIRVRSQRNPDIQKLVLLNPASFPNPGAFMKAVGISAGAAAEQLNLDYGENFDPDEARRMALEFSTELFRKIGERSKQRNGS